MTTNKKSVFIRVCRTLRAHRFAVCLFSGALLLTVTAIAVAGAAPSVAQATAGQPNVTQAQISAAEASAGPAIVSTFGRLVDLTKVKPGPSLVPTQGRLSAASEASISKATQLLVKFSTGVSAAFRANTLAKAGLKETGSIPELSVFVAKLVTPDAEGASGGLSAALESIQTLPGVIWAEPDQSAAPLSIPNDPAYPDQWGPPAVGLPGAWDMTTGSSSVTLAIVDTGLGYINDFAGRVVSPYSAVTHTSNQADWNDTMGHGTGCAGVAAAQGNNGDGMAGAAWNVKIMPVSLGTPDPAWPEATCIEGFMYAIDHGAKIISFSGGGHEYSQAELSMINYARAHGVLIVAAAGNEGPGAGVAYPAALDGVIAVGAVDSSGTVADFSCTGDELDLVAPGEHVVSYWCKDNGFALAYLDGTSFATPMVSGIAALMLSRNPSLTADQITNILACTADDKGPEGWDPQYGDGMVNAQKAVASAGDYTAPVINYSFPTNGSVEKGLIQCNFTSTDNLGVVKIEEYLDGKIQFTCMPRIPHYYDSKTGSYLYVGDLNKPIGGLIDTTKLVDGSSHTVLAIAYDAAGNVGSSQVTFKVDNRPTTTTTASTASTITTTTAPTTTTTTAPTTTTTVASTTSTTSPSGSSTTTTLRPAPSFSDVASGASYFAQITDLASRGIVSGFADGTFRPDDSVSRQQFAKMVVKSLALPVSMQNRCPFTDVDANLDPADPLYPDHYVAVCAAAHITEGINPALSLYGPYTSLTRAQLITMVARAADLPDPPAEYIPPFADFSADHYPWARKAAYAGLLTGLQGIGPSYQFFEPASRGEVCLVLYNLLHPQGA